MINSYEIKTFSVDKKGFLLCLLMTLEAFQGH